MTIKISRPRIEAKGNVARIFCEIQSTFTPEVIWYETSIDNLENLDTELGHWAVVSLIYPAMLLGEAIDINAHLDPIFQSNINSDFQSFAKIFDPRLNNIKITGITRSRPLKNVSAHKKHVATGFSAGIDSFATLHRYLTPETPEDIKISALSIFDVGAFGRSDTDALYYASKERLVKFAKQHGLHVLDARSNVEEFYRQKGIPKSNFEKTNSIRNLGASLIFERNLTYYYLSSSFPPETIAAKKSYNISYLDPIITPLLSTEGTTFISSCAGLSRIEKTRLVSTMQSVENYLDVCSGKPQSRLNSGFRNCSTCPKCIRTLFTLEAINSIQKFSAAFNLERFKSQYARNLFRLLLSGIRGNSLDAEVAILLLKRFSGRL